MKYLAGARCRTFWSVGTGLSQFLMRRLIRSQATEGLRVFRTIGYVRTAA
jgi:hypothetical protein